MKNYIANSWVALAAAILISAVVSAMTHFGASFGGDPLSVLILAMAAAMLAWVNAVVAAIFAWRRRIFPRAWALAAVFGPILTLMVMSMGLRGVEYYKEGGFDIAARIDEWRMQKQFEAESQETLELQRLNNAYVGLENNAASVGQFLDVAQDIIANTAHAKEHGFAFASLFTKLTIKYMKARNYADAGAVVHTYLDKIYPRTGMDENEKSKDFASNALVFAVVTQNDKLAKTILDDLLGSRFDISTEKNEILAYNLACYYALHQEKDKMLAAARRAVQLGKKKQQFIADADFKDYLADKDFQAIFNP